MESPEYITEENQYNFIIWCNQSLPHKTPLHTSINIDKFNMLLQINMEEWIFKNNVSWEFAYGNIIDTLKAQQEIENSMNEETKKKEEREKEEREKPSDKIKRRELFAKKAEERQINTKKFKR